MVDDFPENVEIVYDDCDLLTNVYLRNYHPNLDVI